MTSRRYFGPVFHIIGILLTVLGIAMLVPALVDGLLGETGWRAFVGGSAATLICSVSMVLATGGAIERFTIRQTFLITTLAWIIIAGFGALPMSLSALHLSFADAYFESMSGLTTTGATVIVGLDHAPSSVLLWRALLHWYGGIGIIVMAIAVLPMLRVGGMQLFRTESSERGEKPFATVRDTANGIAMAYVALTLLSAIAFWLAGMTGFDAICHAMAAIATGGYSTHDASLGFYGSTAINWVATISMVLAAFPLTYYLKISRAFRQSRDPMVVIASDSQVQWLLGVVTVMSLVIAFWLHRSLGMPWGEAITQGAVHVASIVSSTGFVAADYGQWGSFVALCFFVLMFVGGCTGSTTGSIKIFRWQVLFRAIGIQLHRMQQPHRVIKPTYHGKALDRDVIESVINLLVAFVACLIIISLVLTAMDIDLLTSVSATAATLANVGPGLGPIVGPVGTFEPLPDAALWVLSLGMLLGRLEVFTVLVLLTPSFWRD